MFQFTGTIAKHLVQVATLGRTNPFTAPKPLPILTSSKFVKKIGFPAVTHLSCQRARPTPGTCPAGLNPSTLTSRGGLLEERRKRR